LTDSGNWQIATNLSDFVMGDLLALSFNSGKPISAISRLASRYQLFAVGAPLKWISHIFWLEPLKPVFWQFKEQVPFNFKNKISAVQWEWKTSRLI
jgi:hypothetical protein